MNNLRPVQAACLATYLFLFWSALSGHLVDPLDWHVSAALHCRSSDPLIGTCIAVSLLASWQFMWGLVATGALLLWNRGDRGGFLAWIASFAAFGAVNEGTRLMLQRPRPHMSFVHEPGGSFPSGHAADALLAGCLLVAIVWPRLKRRGIALAAAIALALAIGMSRMVLQVHFLSDVIAGYCLGGIILCEAVPRFASRAGGPSPRPACSSRSGP